MKPKLDFQDKAIFQLHIFIRGMEKSRKPPAEKSPSAKPVRELVLPIVM
jgi:hypothetical protein